ncbi:hypothetical protein I2492_11120 [Budviciaceae bacterium CWB-B4]|uniref:Uncharacterized protein n=1 Tax=Limnobaculum xujianqingii TaxID=2738837 RepID=A0A9D7FYD2_9GAMM|nr:hypothetical protein [Limnobaculum xujianqingii]MBK5073398.1 hypothetical protein [Limnobaculum xujianqingii]MBK5176871.1 hypothetical protein [Limnobaculum xujianqingii]
MYGFYRKFDKSDFNPQKEYTYIQRNLSECISEGNILTNKYLLMNGMAVKINKIYMNDFTLLLSSYGDYMSKVLSLNKDILDVVRDHFDDKPIEILEKIKALYEDVGISAEQPAEIANNLRVKGIKELFNIL